MTKDKITDYDSSASSNTDVGGVNLAENSALPSDMNNAIREVMSHQKEAFGSGTPLFVDQTNNRVCIGTTTEGNTSADDLTIATTGHTGITLRSGTTQSGAVYFSDGTSGDDEYRGFIDYTHSSNFFRIGTNSAERLRITSDGNVGIGTTSISNGKLVVSGSNGTIGGVSGLATFAKGSTGGGAIESGCDTAAIQIGSDGTNGFISTANNVLRILVNSGERLRIDTTGRLFRGSTSDLTGICQSFFKNIHQGEGGIGIGNNDGANTTNAMIFRNSNGNIGSIQTSSSSTFFNTSSDYRLKENVDYDFNATSRLKQLKPCRFNWISDETNTLIDGFLAHEVSHDADGNPLVPEAISGKKDDTKDRTNVVLSSTNVIVGFNVTEEEWKQGKIDGTYASNTTWSSKHTEILAQQIDQAKLVPLLVKTIQELEARITALEGA